MRVGEEWEIMVWKPRVIRLWVWVWGLPVETRRMGPGSRRRLVFEGGRGVKKEEAFGKGDMAG